MRPNTVESQVIGSDRMTKVDESYFLYNYVIDLFINNTISATIIHTTILLVVLMTLL